VASFLSVVLIDRQEIIPEFFATISNRSPEAGILAVLITFPMATPALMPLGFGGRKTPIIVSDRDSTDLCTAMRRQQPPLM
jgi:hypothetical protein